MPIAKRLTHKLSIVAFIMLIINSHQLNAMEQKSVRNINKVSMEADFQAYLFLSAIDNEHHCYLFPELVQIIATDVFNLINKEYYEKYNGKQLHNPFSLLKFIENKCNEFISDISIANIMKRCLNHSGKLLREIKFYNGTTVFHQIPCESFGINIKRRDLARIEWVEILCLVAGNDAWNIICMQDDIKRTALHANHYSEYILYTLLSFAPRYRAAWKLIITPDKHGKTVLDYVCDNGDTLSLLETYRPKRAVRLKK